MRSSSSKKPTLSGWTSRCSTRSSRLLVRDFNTYAVELHDKAATTDEQARFAMRMIRRPVNDRGRYEQVWKEHVLPLNGAYEMRP